MSVFLKIVSGLYLAFIWLVFALVVYLPTSAGQYSHQVIVSLAFLIAIALSVPAAILFAFAQIVGDIRVMREHLRVMRTYYEPARR